MEKHSSVPSRASRHQQPRSRDENQERAFIAASRRTDRSIEARLQSAYKASELHKKRTGKALRITEQIVFNDETYEEEDLWMPSRALLGPQFQTPSADLNSRVEAYLEQKIVMSNFLAVSDRQQQDRRWEEIDRLFAESFPNAAQTARRLAEDLVPRAPSLLEGDRSGPVIETRCSETTQQGGCAEDTSFFSDEDGHADGLLNESVFTADLPAEVLMFLGQNQCQHQDQVGKIPYEEPHDRFLKTGKALDFGATVGADFGIGVDDHAAQSLIGGEVQSIWSDDLDAYIDPSAWLEYPTADQALT